MRFELKELQQKLGITFIYVTHNQTEATVLSEEMVLMKKRRTPEVYEHRRVEQAKK